MGKHKGRRFSITVDEELYQTLQRIKAEYGFSSICEYTIAAIKVCTAQLQANRQRKPEARSDQQEIIAMFDDYTDWQSKPDGTVPVRHNTKQIK